jgi:hypothetical protein
VLGADRPVDEILVGVPLGEALRWRVGANRDLQWQRAA